LGLSFDANPLVLEVGIPESLCRGEFEKEKKRVRVFLSWID